MQNLFFDEPYKFIPPHEGKIWTAIFKRFLRRYLRKTHGIVQDECRGIERLRQSLDAGHGVILAANHCRPSDPMAMGLVTIEAEMLLYSMASWHVFKQDWLTTFMARRLGAFSVYREGMDRAALSFAIKALEEASRPVAIYPEGSISRTNDYVADLMPGIAFVARAAARKRAKQSPAGKVVIHPVALKYKFLGDVNEALPPVLEEIETRFSWQPQRHLPLVARIAKVGRALLSLKEVEHFGSSQPGSVYGRIDRLIQHLLGPLENEWQVIKPAEDTVIRAKDLRQAIFPDLVGGTISEKERERRWRQLAIIYLAQQLSLYRHDYVRPDSPPERLLETVERFEEDVTDVTRIYGPLKLVIEVGEPIEVSPNRVRNADVDPLLLELRERLQSMITKLADELSDSRSERSKRKPAAPMLV